jgi:methionyl-tRNA formyltransferase
MSTSRFIFFGTPYISRDTLEILKARGYIPAAIVTSPDRPRGRGLHLTPSETKVWAQENNIPVLDPEKITPEIIHGLAQYEAEYGIVVAYGKILPVEVIDSFHKGIINIHYSLLPKYRGASPVEAAVLNGDAVTGVAIQQMVPKLDAGDILAIQEVAIDPYETTSELRPRLITIGANLLADTLPAFEAGTLIPVPQAHSLATRCKKIKKESGLLHLSDDPISNWNKYRAYAESPGTYIFWENPYSSKTIRMKIINATLREGEFIIERVIPEGKKEQPFAIATHTK